MNRKIKYAIAALLGFSTACSTVKTAPKGAGKPQQIEPDTLERPAPPRLVVMYGVRPPEGVSKQIAQPIQPTDTIPTSEHK